MTLTCLPTVTAWEVSVSLPPPMFITVSPVIMYVYIKCFGYDSGTVTEHSVRNGSSVMMERVRICRDVVPRVALHLLLVLNYFYNPFFSVTLAL
jgi:hypothetical protein